MTERPIIFTPDEIPKLLDGSKTRYRRLYSRGRELDPEHLKARLLNGISHVDEHGCWIWGRTLSSGYGSMTVGGKTVRSHRLALALSLGVSERSLEEVCHHCDNPRCVNPEHLFEGTHGDNVRDAVQKGRAKPPESPAYRGESNPSALLTERDVRAIRHSLTLGETQSHLAAVYGVSQSAISAIGLRKTWRHLP